MTLRHVACNATCDYVIQNWRGRVAEAIHQGRTPRAVSAEVARAARRRLDQLDAATRIEDMRSPPSNRLHPAAGRWSISVKAPYQITFRWGENGPEDVWFGECQ